MALEDTKKEIEQVIQKLPPITLEQMSGIKLMNRIDKKYIINVKNLPLLLEMAKNDYYVQETDGTRFSLYRSCYYDTADANMYMIHEDGKKTRQKIRVREYVYSKLTFLEIKDKNNKGRTSKTRIKVPDTEVLGQEEAKEFLDERSKYPPETINKRLQNQFYRITLVNKLKTERLTIDMEIKYHNYKTGNDAINENLCIIELKRDGNKPSPFLDYFFKLRIKNKGISKYCYGMMLTDSSLKMNRFKPVMRYIQKITD